MNWDDFWDTPHRRWNPLLREWVLISPHRVQRPWLGQVAKPAASPQLRYDPDCYLCPGNVRSGGLQNPAYTATFAFENDFPALLPNVPDSKFEKDGLLVARAERGICRVVCFSPRHDLAIPRMKPDEVRLVVDAWVDQYRELSALPWIRHIEIFENRGAMMGMSNPHPHCQIWANSELPDIPSREQAALSEYRQSHGTCLLCAYLRLELESRERIICENEGFVALVPFWAVWPFETLVVSRRHVSSMLDLYEKERDHLADILRRLTIRYDNLFETPFPYSMGFHQQPSEEQEHFEWHFHAHYFPPLLRSATVQKFIVGYELLAGPQRDITAESAASRLRALPEVHYLDRT
jgi:UDPglucose--hexose-1-phosphate uridylyltransferase